MFNYLKQLKRREYEKETDEQQTKPKNDKVFIGILIVFGVMIAVSLVTGIGNMGTGNAVQNMDYGFKISISDCVVLGIITLAYIVNRIRKGKK